MGLKNRLISNKKIYPFLMAVKSLKNIEIRNKVWDLSHNRDELIIRHGGDLYTGKIIYNININEGSGGFFALMRWACTALEYADNRGFLPYVCFGEKCRYFDEGIEETDNVFEYYFEPVSEVMSVEVGYASNIIDYETKHLQEVECSSSFQLVPEIVDCFSEIWKKYIKINNKTYSSIMNEMSSILDLSKRTLGIHVRGTDFKENYSGHPVAVSLSEEIQIAKELMKHEYEQIFLATDEVQTIHAFEEEFGDKVKYYSNTYRSSDGTAIHDSKASRPLHYYLNGYEVLRDAYTLARCNGLITGVSNVSFFVMVINKAEGRAFNDCKICYHGMNKNSKIYTKGK